MFTRKHAASDQQELFVTVDTEPTMPCPHFDASRTNLDLYDTDPTDPDMPQADADSRLDRNQLISRIIQVNTTATETYLESFSDDMLWHYLAHLETLKAPRGSAWNRPGDTPAILEYETCF